MVRKVEKRGGAGRLGSAIETESVTGGSDLGAAGLLLRFFIFENYGSILLFSGYNAYFKSFVTGFNNHE